jgi:23S rRNA (uracil1939-C5)-methyltransferase
MDERIIETELTAMSNGGEALGRYEGKVVFVAGGIPGEVVRVEIVQDRKRYARGRLREVISPSPDRVAPSCSHCGLCGGCDWQHIEYERQLSLKVEVLRGQLARKGCEARMAEPIGMASPWFYRNHVRFFVDGEGKPSFREGRSHRPVPIEECCLLHPLLLETLQDLELRFEGLLELELRAGINTGEVLLVLWVEGEQAPALELASALSCVVISEEGEPLAVVGHPFYHETLWERTFRVSFGSFFQVNTLQAEALAEVVLAYLFPEGDELVLDAYCGVGTFGLLLADRVGEVVGVEENPMAVDDAGHNAADTPNVRFVEGTLADVVPQLRSTCDLAVLDPPRGGCDREDLEALMGASPRRIAYVSCDAATLARDVKRLADGGYHLEEVQVVDMFPQTSHIESVSLLVRG